MLKKWVFLLPVCVGVIPGCMSTPDLSEATGTEHSEILIKDVVQRVKCELSDAFDEKTKQRDFRWLASWTAHADLTLQVNDRAGVAPVGTYTKHLRQVTTPLTRVTEAFSLGFSANLNGQATRSETVSFTIALGELKLWRKHLDKMEAKLPPEKRTCYFDGAAGVTGNLGLKQWVDSAFFPVQTGQLQAGIHPYGGGGGRATKVRAPSSGGRRAKADVALTRDKIAKDAAAWAKELSRLQAKTKSSFAKIDAAVQALAAADADLQNKLQILSDSKYQAVLAPYLRTAYGKSKSFAKYLKRHKDDEKKCVQYKVNLSHAVTLLGELQAELSKPGNEVSTAMEMAHNSLADEMDGIHDSDYPAQSAKCATALTQAADRAAKNAAALPDHIDPPIDSVAHSVSFVVAYGAGISPSWTLLQWRGPGSSSSNSPLFGASGTRTHSLTIALAPRSGGPAIGTDALRLINNQVIRSLGN